MERENTLLWDFWQTQIKFSNSRAAIQLGHWELLEPSLLGQKMQAIVKQPNQIGSEIHKADVGNMIHITVVNTVIELHYFWDV